MIDSTTTSDNATPRNAHLLTDVVLMLIDKFLSTTHFTFTNNKQAPNILRTSYDGWPDEIPVPFVKWGDSEFLLLCLKWLNIFMDHGAYPYVRNKSFNASRFKTRSRSDVANRGSIKMKEIIHQHLLTLPTCPTSPSQHGFAINTSASHRTWKLLTKLPSEKTSVNRR